MNKDRFFVNYSNVGELDFKCLEIIIFYNLGCCLNVKYIKKKKFKCRVNVLIVIYSLYFKKYLFILYFRYRV